MQVDEFPAGDDQTIVIFVSDDDGGPIHVASLVTAVATDAASRRAQGWKILSTNTIPMRQTGTAGNILFQSGGQYATQAALMVVYGRQAGGAAG